jgi:DNA-binding NarL/FixJ family response regulator
LGRQPAIVTTESQYRLQPSPVRVLIVDDHTLVRAGICRLLQSLPDVEVVAEACNAQQAIDMAVIHRPDVILLDLSLPDRSGLEVLRPLQEALPQTKVVMMSMHNDPTQVRSALDRGCAGFVVKEAAPMELELALRAAAAGQVFLSPQVSSKMLAPMLSNTRPTGVQALSPRQREILGKLGGGMSSKEIAAVLGISVKTVETHRARMMESLGCRRANDLLLLAARHQHELT